MNAPSNLGTGPENIDAAEKTLAVRFPRQLRDIWLVLNGMELPGSWRFLPVFDPGNPRKTSNDIVYENTKGRWPTMGEDLVSIAVNDYGDQLVLPKTGVALLAEVRVWDHETSRTRKWSKSLDYILEQARRRLEKIARAREKGQRRSKPNR